MPKSGSALTGVLWRGHLDGVAGTLGFPLERRLAYAHHDAGCCCRGKSNTLPTPPRRVARSICLPRRGLLCSRVSGSKQTVHRTRSFVGDELEGRKNPARSSTLQASPEGAGGCAASHAGGLGRPVRFGRRNGRARLDWKGEEPPSNMHDGRAAASPIAMKLSWMMLFSYRFSRCNGELNQLYEANET